MDRKSSAVDTVTVAVSRIIGSLTMDDICTSLTYILCSEKRYLSHTAISTQSIGVLKITIGVWIVLKINDTSRS